MSDILKKDIIKVIEDLLKEAMVSDSRDKYTEDVLDDGFKMLDKLENM